MMHFGAMKWFGSFIRKLTESIGLYHPRDLHPCYYGILQLHVRYTCLLWWVLGGNSDSEINNECEDWRFSFSEYVLYQFNIDPHFD